LTFGHMFWISINVLVNAKVRISGSIVVTLTWLGYPEEYSFWDAVIFEYKVF
jgi:hypothetical protein